MLKIYLNTWKNYNENGADGGKWIELPADEDELAEAMEALAAELEDEDPEWFINDYEWAVSTEFCGIGENENIEHLNELLNQLENLDEWDREKVAAILEADGGSLENALNSVDNYILYRGMDMDEVAQELVEECYFTKDTPEILKRYFDYEAFARDLGFDGYTETRFGVLVGD